MSKEKTTANNINLSLDAKEWLALHQLEDYRRGIHASFYPITAYILAPITFIIQLMSLKLKKLEKLAIITVALQFISALLMIVSFSFDCINYKNEYTWLKDQLEKL